MVGAKDFMVSLSNHEGFRLAPVNAEHSPVLTMKR